MRLLVVGHSYIVASNQKKYATLKRLNPSLELRVVSPPKVKGAFRSYEHEMCPGLGVDEAIAMKVFFNRSNMTYILDPMAFLKLLRHFKPTLIHIEEDPHSLVAFETIILASIFCPKIPISFFIWDNLNHIARFPLNFVKRWLTGFALARAAFIVAGNREAQKLLGTEKHYRGPSFVLPQFGIDYAAYLGEAKAEIARSVAKQTGVSVIGFMGRLVPEKGVLMLCQALEALKQLPWKLIVIGSGPLEKVLQEQWKPKFGERLALLGPGSSKDLPDYLKCIDILAAPSVSTPVWKEQFGYILVEAMASGAVVLGSSSGAIPEVIGEAGVVFPEGNVAHLKDVLARLLQSADERNEFSRVGRARAQEFFSHETVSASYMKLFQRFSNA